MPGPIVYVQIERTVYKIDSRSSTSEWTKLRDFESEAMDMYGRVPDVVWVV